jgi:hypothetical protein
MQGLCVDSLFVRRLRYELEQANPSGRRRPGEFRRGFVVLFLSLSLIRHRFEESARDAALST